MKFSHNKDVNSVVRKLIKSGWEPIKKARHWQVKSPQGDVLTVPNTPSDGRAVLNFKCDVRRTAWGQG